MSLRTRLLAGPFALALLVLGVVGLAWSMPGYSHARQTVSEIGAIGSPARVPFAMMLCGVALCALLCAHGVRDAARAARQSSAPAYLIGAMAISIAGVALFAHPHPLHNVFGLSELIGYQAPVVLAVTWRRHPMAGAVVRLSWLLYAVIVIAIVLNLSSVLGMTHVAAYVQPHIGVAQRVLFGAWFCWLGALGLLLPLAGLTPRHQPPSDSLRPGVPAA